MIALSISDGTAIPLARPEPLSHGRLRALEGCALRWALGRSEVADEVPMGRTPHGIYVGVLGSAKHAFVRLLCARATAASTLAGAVNAGGGVATITESALDEATLPLRTSPRCEAAVAEDAVRAARGDWLVATRADGLSMARAVLAPGRGELDAEPVVPIALDDGLWEARPDLVETAGDRVTITDFKTGAAAEEPAMHAEQLLTYAALWRAGPGGHTFTLRVVTPGGVAWVHNPTDGDLEEHTWSLARRGEAARRAGQAATASPHPARCGPCPVRARCPTFWATQTPATGPWHDFEAEVRAPWNPVNRSVRIAVVASPTGLPVGGEHDVSVEQGVISHPERLERGDRVRLLGVRLGSTLFAAAPKLRTALRGAELWLVR